MATVPAGPVISEVGRRYLQLQMTPDLGPVRLRKLLEHFGMPEAILSASQGALERVEGVGPHVASSIFEARRGEDIVDREIERAAQCGARILCLADEEYPQALQHIPDPPTCLYVRGALQPTDAVALAIVGTRRCSHYGREQATRFGELLARAGFTVISGLARGVDGHAHRGALRAGGRTIAVLGNGLGRIYPPEHAELAAAVQQSGAILSELAVNVGPESKNFPGRNRIITGLALGVLVVEAGKRSGALITARLASEYNREVFALPGNIDRPDLTAGTNALIRDGGAKLVTCLEDILDELGHVGEVMRCGACLSAGGYSPAASEAATTPERTNRLTELQRVVYEAVAQGAADVDTICEISAIDAGAVGRTLTALELAGFVSRLPGNRVRVRRP